MDNFRIYDIGSRKAELQIETGIPNKYAKLKIEDSECFHVIRNNETLPDDTFIFQIIDLGFCEVHIHHYFVFNHDDKIVFKSEGKHNMIFFCLKGDIMYRLKEMEWQFLHETDFNMLSADGLSQQIYCKKKEEHLLVYVLFPEKDFIDLLETYPAFSDFTMNVRKGIDDVLFTRERERNMDLYTVYKVFLLLKALDGPVVFNKNILKQYLTELFNHILFKDNYDTSEYKYNYAFLEEIYKMELQINEHFSESHCLRNCLKENNLSSEKIRKFFRLIFGKTPKNYLIEIRLKEAQSLLRRGIDKKLTAVRTGYNSYDLFKESLIKNAHADLKKPNLSYTFSSLYRFTALPWGYENIICFTSPLRRLKSNAGRNCYIIIHF